MIRKKFAQIHKVSEVPQILSDEKLRNKLSTVPQIHFVGSKDKIIPIDIVESYKEKLPENNCIKIIQIRDTSHWLGWKEKWTDLLKENPQCLRK